MKNLAMLLFAASIVACVTATELEAVRADLDTARVERTDLATKLAETQAKLERCMKAADGRLIDENAKLREELALSAKSAQAEAEAHDQQIVELRRAAELGQSALNYLVDDSTFGSASMLDRTDHHAWDIVQVLGTARVEKSASYASPLNIPSVETYLVVKAGVFPKAYGDRYGGEFTGFLAPGAYIGRSSVFRVEIITPDGDILDLAEATSVTVR